MSAPGPKLAQGAIVWACVCDPRGNAKERPLIILTETSEILHDEPVVAVAVTTAFPEPPPFEFVELPWAPQRHPATRLSRRSAAACRWLVELRPSQVLEIRGHLPTTHLLTILKRVAALHQK
jgi:hypothetical protein